MESNENFQISDFRELSEIFKNQTNERRQLTLNKSLVDEYFMDCIEFGVPLSHASINKENLSLKILIIF